MRRILISTLLLSTLSGCGIMLPKDDYGYYARYLAVAEWCRKNGYYPHREGYAYTQALRNDLGSYLYVDYDKLNEKKRHKFYTMTSSECNQSIGVMMQAVNRSQSRQRYIDSFQPQPINTKSSVQCITNAGITTCN